MTDGTSGEAREQAGLSTADEQLLRELTERALAGGLKLTGEGCESPRALPDRAGRLTLHAVGDARSRKRSTARTRR
jgi:hypothetical protein